MLSMQRALGAPAAESPAAAWTARVAELHADAAAHGVDLASAPAWLPIPELGLTPITPGPGLPSLESLNLTWEQLVMPPAPAAAPAAAASATLERRYTPTCVTNTEIWGNEALHCYNYLSGLGSTACVVNPSVQFCQNGSTRWHGRTQNNGWDSTTCKSVADGGRWVIDNCYWIDSTWGTKRVREGTNAAWGKENIIVRLYR